LNKEGYLVLWARNGKEALKHLEESLCDLVVLDIVMPEMDGIEVLPKIVSRYRNMPVILHTAYAHYKSDFMIWLADAFVVKSSDLSVLKKTVKELLKKNDEEKNRCGARAPETRGFYETNP
jgi:DNA-binding NtrC family response regulator